MSEFLFIDADDTLWENFAYFEIGRSRFLDYMEEGGFDRASVDILLSRIDAARTGDYGFGSMGFKRAMERTMHLCFERRDRVLSDADMDVLNLIQQDIFYHPVQPYEGVPETLDTLSRRHPLVLVTKGFEDEQLGKVERSGLSVFFEDVVVVPDKTEAVYRDLLSSHDVTAERAWMIGNSPRSDINPAAAAGLGTVLVEKEKGWDFEEVPLQTNGRSRKIRAFSQLTRWF